MNRSFKIARGRDRRGKVVVLVAILLPTVLIPILGLGVDGGTLMQDQRRLHGAVDAAALAAAAQLWRDNSDHNLISSPPPVTDAAIDAALKMLDNHGFTSEVCQSREITTPASSANQRVDGKGGTIEVEVTFLQPRSFTRIWSKADLPVKVRSVARVKNFSQGNGILILEESEPRALYGQGSGTLLVNEGGVVVNSTSQSAAETSGNQIVLAATSFDVAGKAIGDRYYETPYPESGPANPYDGSTPVPDPLADLPEPDPAAFVNRSTPHGGSGNVTLQPGRYRNRLSFTGNTVVNLEPGVYYLEKGISVLGDVTLTGTGVTIYNVGSGSANNIQLQGNGTWSLTPPTSGPYEGVALYQSRNTASQDTTMTLQGNGGAGLVGTVYAPTTKVLVTGSGTQTLGSQFIARTLEMSGSGHFTVDFAAPKAPQPPVVELIE
jgi:hypothetical protein